jgi:translation elongation factor EF-Ts
MNSFFAERVLLDQEFFNASVFKGTIANYLKQNGVGLQKYVRIEVGQG